jgi:hypothetical protein
MTRKVSQVRVLYGPRRWEAVFGPHPRSIQGNGSNGGSNRDRLVEQLCLVGGELPICQRTRISQRGQLGYFVSDT